MMLLFGLGDPIEKQINDAKTLTITYEIRKSSDNSLFTSGTMIEVGSTGIYQTSTVSFNNLGKYRIEYTTPITYENMIDDILIIDSTDEIKDRIGEPASGETVVSKIDDNETKLDSIISTLSGLVANIWAYGTRTLTSFGTLIANIVDQVWDEEIAEHLGGDKAGQHIEDADATADPSAVADAVWDENIGDHLGGDKAGQHLEDADATADPEAVADAVWDELVSGHSVVGSFAELLKRIAGLCQENYRIFNPVYVTKNRQQCMTSATIKIYPSSTDCENDTNAIAEYQITATFANDATMTNYKVKKV